MLVAHQYTSEKRDEWDDYIKRSSASHFMFQRDYMEYHADRFADHSLMIRDEEGRLFALLPGNLRAGVIQSHGGLTFGGLQYPPGLGQALCLDLFKALQTYLDEHSLASISYRPVPIHYLTQPSQAEQFALFHLGATLEKRIFYSVTSLRHPVQLQSRRVRGAKKALNSGASLHEETDYGAWSEYWSLLKEVLHTRFNSKPVHSFEEIWQLRTTFPAEIQLHSVRLQGRIVAGVIIFETPLVAKTQYIASGEAGREIGALDLLFHHSVTERFAGKNYFDFGSSVSDDECGFNRGLVEQKEGFGAFSVVQDTFTIRSKSLAPENNP